MLRPDPCNHTTVHRTGSMRCTTSSTLLKNEPQTDPALAGPLKKSDRATNNEDALRIELSDCSNVTRNAWWSWSGSNRRPTACKAAALPAELQPPLVSSNQKNVVGLVGFEPTTPALSRRCSNQLSYRPSTLSRLFAWTTDKVWILGRTRLLLLKGGDPAAPSDTATLLRLHPSHESHRGKRPPEG